MPIKFNEKIGTYEWIVNENPVPQEAKMPQDIPKFQIGDLPDYMHPPEYKKKESIKNDENSTIVDGIRMKINDPRIVDDIFTGKKTNKDLASKVFTNIKKNEFGYTRHSNKYPLGVHETLGKIYASTTDIFIEAGMTESLINGLFFSPSVFNNNYTDYRRFENQCSLKDPFQAGDKSRTYLLTEGMKYTFGVELEYSKLYIPEYLAQNFNFKCMKDGSLNAKAGGPEIVTGVLIGDSGLHHLQDMCLELAKRGTIDEYCSIHIHIGGFDATKEFTTLAYILGNKLENELFSIIPPSRRKNEYCRTLKTGFTKKEFAKNYRERQIELDEYFHHIYQWLSHYQIGKGSEINRKANHPMGAKCQYDHSTPRYCWLNLIPTAFNTRENESYTLEFRNHSGTSNFIKIFNWIKICMAFVYFIENHKERILTEHVTLNDIIREAYPKSWIKLDNYIEERKMKFATQHASAEEKKEYKEGCNEKKSIKELLECV